MYISQSFIVMHVQRYQLVHFPSGQCILWEAVLLSCSVFFSEGMEVSKVSGLP